LRLCSKEWVVRVLEEMGGEASLELLRLMSAGVLPSKYYVADCYFPDVSDKGLSCIEEALKELERKGVIRVKGDKVVLSELVHVENAL